MTNDIDHTALAEALLPAVLAAGRLEMGYFTGGVAVERKADCSPVTAADREAEAILVEALHEAAPGVPVVAEEAAAGGRIPAAADVFFLVDPLDGTREFVAGRPEFTINIGLVANGRPVFGLVYSPASSGILRDARAGTGRDGCIAADAAVSSLAACALEPIATREPDLSCLIAIESRSTRNAATERFLHGLGVRQTLTSGSSVKFCVIARGDADLYPRLGETSEWDTAAGQAILEAAGGAVRTLDGAPLLYGKAAKAYINPHFVAWGRAATAARV